MQKTYEVESSQLDEFMEKAESLRSVRLRDGATFWGIYSDSQRPNLVYEIFQHAPEADPIRSHERFTKEDRRLEEELLKYHVGSEPPRVQHLSARL